MPSLARKLLVFAAADGVVVQPLASKKDQRPAAPVKIRYGDASLSSVAREALPELTKTGPSFEAFGIVGLITVSKFTYLISITRRQQVAVLRGSPIFVVSEVALTPLAGHQDAAAAVDKTAQGLQRKPTDRSSPGDSDSEDESLDLTAVPSVAGSDEVGDESSGAEGPRPAGAGGKTTIAQDVISRRGSYGRFAQRWFSRSGWQQDQKRSLGLSPEAAAPEAAGAENDSNNNPVRKVGDDTEDSAAVSLLPKLLRTTAILLGSSRSFVFSYDLDVTRSLGRPPSSTQGQGGVEEPLHRRVDERYFWNANVLRPLMASGCCDALCLPLMQGFVGQRTFVVDGQPPQVDDGAGKESVEMRDFSHQEQQEQEQHQPGVSAPGSPPAERETRPSERRFVVTVISRRSVLRAGLRYLRRGVDEEGNVANTVESEQILSPADEASSEGTSTKVYSFVQVRGSIPLFFTQTPYSLRPAPVIRHSLEANYGALKKHFDGLRQRYGQLQIVNLVEKHGVEGPLGTQFQRSLQRFNEDSTGEDWIPFEWFDFHDACRGMKFENVSLLLGTLGKKLLALGSTTLEQDGGAIVATQKGVLRTNCMDCLDRTNVCQSSFAKFMLDAQLKEQGFDMTLQRDQENAWFNTLWADNGDAISKQYASTGAMKGDFTRTRKRDYRGALTDVGLSLTRFFNGMVNDFFLQTTIDFLLGNVTYKIFDEFEANMMTKDPAVSMQTMRQQAIELCQKRVVENDAEELVGGWTLLSPNVSDTLTTQPFEEVVLLLTDAALYLCRFDWALDKVSSFERVDLAHVERLKFGPYIISTVSPSAMDELTNVGLLVTYRPGAADVVRVNTRSMSTVVRDLNMGARGGALGLAGLLTGRARQAVPAAAAGPPERRIALKALYAKSARAEVGGGGGATAAAMTEIQQVVAICSEIERLALLSKPVFATGGKRESIIEGGDIVSLADAKKSTGLLEHLGHSIKKMVWA